MSKRAPPRDSSMSSGLLELRVISATERVAIVKALREITDLPLSGITSAISDHLPIPIGELSGPQASSVGAKALMFFQTLQEAGANVELLLNGRLETPESLRRGLEASKMSLEQGRMLASLESGSPDIAALQWLKGYSNFESDPESYLSTLRQIASGDGYDVDSETMAWVLAELGPDGI